ncbi:MarR family winged helix-turn-helix transcriptional regulator [Amphibacillus cookii]|uniref:MarR family winged helix-turn-helix transcriptional regulator n=1 Tax=Amphibacillus cookii TaxID=767787 RepID=UPI001959BD90|nr:MarR family transcriptional regulator [Amphibacillus cookii]MBM7540005.1 DNA-binding MarR family transcriptional regulator [Amphibacillus cookii]
MNKDIPDIHDLLQDLSWYFGNQGFDDECCEDLSLAEYMALKKVYDIQNITIKELGVSLNITKSGISKIIDRLEKKCYVSRHQSSSDGRICCVLPTEKGNNAIHKISNRYSEYLDEILGAVDEEALQNIKDTLELLFKAIQDKGFIKSN